MWYCSFQGKVHVIYLLIHPKLTGLPICLVIFCRPSCHIISTHTRTHRITAEDALLACLVSSIHTRSEKQSSQRRHFVPLLLAITLFSSVFAISCHSLSLFVTDVLYFLLALFIIFFKLLQEAFGFRQFFSAHFLLVGAL